MIKKITEYFKKSKERKRVKNLVKLSYAIIFSEKHDLSIDKEVDKFINEIKNTCKNQIEALQAFSILNPILYERIPIEKIDFNIFSDFNNLIKNQERNSEMLSIELDLEKTKFKMNLLVIDAYLKVGKKEFEKNKYSYRGIVYDIEKIKKAPVTSNETEKFKNIAKDLHELYEQRRNLESENNNLQ